jgi:hypothetical protein
MKSNRWCKIDQVVCRSEGRADTRPIKFRIGDQWILIDRVVSEWLEKSPKEASPTFRLFEIECDWGTVRLRVVVDGWNWEAKVRDEL